ncbi:hypothetical protein PsYK624_151390 [Phanerochaete sordida]|uniref:Uncharacterized protein n=1 Tax=Phanerochaete sordida TaxID=48140 RepID=A0A9P3GPV6_9APHY|nr:hypothetical protein PsYK624_151390 [Phanerochaete sordida]
MPIGDAHAPGPGAWLWQLPDATHAPGCPKAARPWIREGCSRASRRAGLCLASVSRGLGTIVFRDIARCARQALRRSAKLSELAFPPPSMKSLDGACPGTT